MITKKDLIDAIDDLEKRVQSLEEIINNQKLKELLNDYNEISLKDLADFTNAFGHAVLKVDDKVNDIKTKVEKDLDRTKINNESFKREVYEYVKTNIEKMRADLYKALLQELKSTIDKKIDEVEKRTGEFIQEITEDLIDEKMKEPQKDIQNITEVKQTKTVNNEDFNEKEEVESNNPEKLLLDYLSEPHIFNEIKHFAELNHFSLSRVFSKLKGQGLIKKREDGYWIRSDH